MFPLSAQRLLAMVCCGMIVAHCTTAFSSPRNTTLSSPHHRDLNEFSKWANRHGVVMHESLQWKQYPSQEEDSTEDNFGLELKEYVEPGTVLLKVPKSIIFRGSYIRKELEDQYPEKVQYALALLEEHGIEGSAGIFFIFVKMVKSYQEGESSLWAPYIQFLPRSFVEFSSVEKNCLPFYTKEKVNQREQLYEFFRMVALESGILDPVDSSAETMDLDQIEWAFRAIYSRMWEGPKDETEKSFWGSSRSVSKKDKSTTTMELVPIGDMFNHGEPPNVRFEYERDFVKFVYTSNPNTATSKELSISYGKPANPHFFVALYGFLPVAHMPYVWSQVFWHDNPFTIHEELMSFGTADGICSDAVWNATLYQFQKVHGLPSLINEEQHDMYLQYTSKILYDVFETELDNLKALAVEIQSVEATYGTNSRKTKNLKLIKQQNSFLTHAFKKAQFHAVLAQYVNLTEKAEILEAALNLALHLGVKAVLATAFKAVLKAALKAATS